MNPLPKIVRRIIIELISDTADHRTVRLAQLALALWPEQFYQYTLLRAVAGSNAAEVNHLWPEVCVPFIAEALEIAARQVTL